MLLTFISLHHVKSQRISPQKLEMYQFCTRYQFLSDRSDRLGLLIFNGWLTQTSRSIHLLHFSLQLFSYCATEYILLLENNCEQGKTNWESSSSSSSLHPGGWIKEENLFLCLAFLPQWGGGA